MDLSQTSQAYPNDNINSPVAFDLSPSQIQDTWLLSPSSIAASQPDPTGLQLSSSEQNLEPVTNGSTGESFRCEYCQRKFCKKFELTKHLRNHTRPCVCHLCPPGSHGGVAQLKDLNRHYWTHHRQFAELNKLPRDKAACFECGYEGRKDQVKRHQKVHNRMGR